MLIFSIDSSALVASAALCDGDKLIAEITADNGNTHSETLLPMVETLLKISNKTISDVELFAASNGPGSFTGVRIGAATLKGLAFGRDIPTVEVSTLEALAENISFFEGLICPVMNARRSQVYTALFRSDGKTLTRLVEDSAMSISELDAMLSEYGEKVYFSGDGYDITLAGLEKTTAAHTPKKLRLQSAYSVASVALRNHREGLGVTTDRSFTVDYLRPSQAERELIEKNQAKN